MLAPKMVLFLRGYHPGPIAAPLIDQLKKFLGLLVRRVSGKRGPIFLALLVARLIETKSGLCLAVSLTKKLLPSRVRFLRAADQPVRGALEISPKSSSTGKSSADQLKAI